MDEDRMIALALARHDMPTTAPRVRRGSAREEAASIAWRNVRAGIPDSRWCNEPDCDLLGLEHGHDFRKGRTVRIDLERLPQHLRRHPRLRVRLLFVAGFAAWSGLMVTLGAVIW